MLLALLVSLAIGQGVLERRANAQVKGKVTVPNNPIQIADAALYLSKTKTDLGITAFNRALADFE